MRVLMFPGQSSADSQMLVRAAAMHPATTAIINRATDVLGDRAHLYFRSEGTALDSNRDVQLSVFLATQMHLAALAAEGLDSEWSLGLSLGEYSHLVHIGALTFESALRLVDARGAAYDMSPPGMMTAVLAADGETVETVVREAAVYGDIAVSNYNAPTQHVIAGDVTAVTWASTRLEDEHLAHTVVIERRVPMHTALLSGVASGLLADLEGAAWQKPARRYLPNVLGSWSPDTLPGAFVARLTDHVTRPVRWRESIEMMFAAHPDATFVEVGPGSVLRNMFGRRWIRPASAGTDCAAGADPEAHFRAAVDALRAGS
jgi:[acyl-carrier-protein] S-malonyltransferase